MRIVLVAVGKARRGATRELYESYIGRLNWQVALKEIEEKRPLPAGELRAREAELLAAAVPKDATLVALDAAGRALTSEAFAARIGAWRDDGVRDLAFVVGGAEGLHEGILARAELVLSLGPMTWPHLMVRALLAEQLYRAQSILAGHPYHRG